jgi:hypothetical protein
MVGAVVEVEFVNTEGRTVLQATLTEGDLEPVRNGEPGTA